MKRMPKLLAVLGAAASLFVLLAAASQPADARRGHGGHGGWHGGGVRVVVGGYRPYRPAYVYRPAYRPVYVASPYYYRPYYDDCGWLKRRAIHTGSPYWWHRYRACRGW